MKNSNGFCRFIDLEGDNTNNYERNYVNVNHIIRVEKLSNSEDSKIKVHLIDGTVLTPNRTYTAIKREIEE